MAVRIDSWESLKDYKKKITKDAENETNVVVAVGMATCGVAAGADTVMDALKDEIEKTGLSNVSLVSTGCLGFCYAEPMVEVRVPGEPWIRYGYIDEKTARGIVRRHIIKGELLDSAIIGQEVQRP
ncbi:MAG: (2Fe-2S) ferredoxin domain-containing protein [Defluviitaleaceae bacterium]|nr:(2Fe-2S) ferredoxin domain-containing protein [Defluviitaleaceae bacterium]